MILFLFAAIYFPLISPVWEKTPFDSENIRNPYQQCFLPDEDLAFQKTCLKEIQDQKVRGKIVNALPLTNNSGAIGMLENIIVSEKDEMIIAETLSSLYRIRNFPEIRKVAEIEALISHPHPLVRGYAAALYLGKTNGTQSLLNMLDKEQTPFVAEFIWKELAGSSARPDLAKVKALTSPERIPENRAGAIRVLAMYDNAPYCQELIKAATDPDVSVRVALARGLLKRDEQADKLLEQLSKDANASVRGVVASVPDGSAARQAIKIALSADPDQEVRRVACISLGEYKSDGALDALLPKLNDPIILVRDATEDSLIKIKPGDKHVNLLGDKYLDEAPAVDSTLRVLGRLGAKKYSGKIEKILSDSKSPLTSSRAVTALADLDYKNGWKTIVARSKDESIIVRRSVAEALGRLNVQESFDTLVALSDDKSPVVGREALKAMGVIANPVFFECAYRHASNFSPNVNPDIRAFACWAIGRIGMKDKKINGVLESIALRKIIVVQGMAMYDAMYSRMAACWTLADFARKDPSARNFAENVYGKFLATTAEESGGASLSIAEAKNYVSQLKAYMDGKPAEPVEIPTVKPEMPVSYVKKSED